MTNKPGNFDKTTPIQGHKLAAALSPERVRDPYVLRCQPRQSHQRTWHGPFAYAIVIIVRDGSGSVSLGERRATFFPASCFYITPGADFTFGPSPGQKWSFASLCLSLSGLERMQEMGWFPKEAQAKVWAVDNCTSLLNRWRQISHHLQRGKLGDADRAALLAHMALMELRLHRRRADKQTSADPLIDAIMSHCLDKLETGVDFHRLAEELSVSYSSLRQRLKTYSGHSPQRFFHHLRCNRAKYRLIHSEDSITAIAESLGYEDPFNFSRVFKRTVGMSPRSYRQAHALWQ